MRDNPAGADTGRNAGTGESRGSATGADPAGTRGDSISYVEQRQTQILGENAFSEAHIIAVNIVRNFPAAKKRRNFGIFRQTFFPCWGRKMN